jgi:hypothetical protein
VIRRPHAPRGGGVADPTPRSRDRRRAARRGRPRRNVAAERRLGRRRRPADGDPAAGRSPALLGVATDTLLARFVVLEWSLSPALILASPTGCCPARGRAGPRRRCSTPATTAGSARPGRGGMPGRQPTPAQRGCRHVATSDRRNDGAPGRRPGVEPFLWGVEVADGVVDDPNTLAPPRRKGGRYRDQEAVRPPARAATGGRTGELGARC